MEMNTRLQVEHPVTELITGLDLVEWQLRVAAGEPLPLRAGEHRCRGPCDRGAALRRGPARGFLPATGRLAHLRCPERGPAVRVDAGIRGGDEISVHYDPHDREADRSGAGPRRRPCASCGRRWRQTEIAACGTNLDVPASAIAVHPAFEAARSTPASSSATAPISCRPMRRSRRRAWASPAPSWRSAGADRARARRWRPAIPGRPGARQGLAPERRGPSARSALRSDGTVHTDRRHLHDRTAISSTCRPGAASCARSVCPMVDVASTSTAATPPARCARRGNRAHGVHGRRHEPVRAGRSAGRERRGRRRAGGHLAAPMPGKVIAVAVKAGDEVKRGAPLMVAGSDEDGAHHRGAGTTATSSGALQPSATRWRRARSWWSSKRRPADEMRWLADRASGCLPSSRIVEVGPRDGLQNEARRCRPRPRSR